MRILASNPDTIGDVVLRQPLYQALIQAGHELTLIVRPLLAPVISAIAPGARVLICDAPLYDPRLAPNAAALDPIAQAAADAMPDLFLVAPFQWTVLEERLASALPRTRCIAMTGRPFADVTFGPAPPSSIRPFPAVQVAEDVPETRKNELLAAAVLGQAVKLPDPAISPAPEHLLAAAAVLSRLGLEPGGYWVACIGDTQYTSVRNWSPKRWSEVLASWSRRYGRKFLVIGHQSEQATAKAIIDGMGDQSGSAIPWLGAGDGDLDILLGLVAHGIGYVGRDTGPMHIAAALKKPVLAVFGGGTWPRFLPAVDPSISLTVGVPCTGCGWVCHLPESYCIKEVPVEAVLGAIDELESGRAATRDARIIKPDGALLARIGREGGIAARGRLIELSVTRREHMEQSDSLAAVLERALKQAGRAEAVAEELDAAKAEFVRRESILKQRLAAAENSFRAREADLLKRLADAENAPLSKAGAAELQAARQRESELSAQLARVQAELVQARAQASDSQIKLSRTERDAGALAALSRQQETEVVVLRRRLHDLMASRWRRYGQRLGLCMTMPWEKETLNGKH